MGGVGYRDAVHGQSLSPHVGWSVNDDRSFGGQLDSRGYSDSMPPVAWRHCSVSVVEKLRMCVQAAHVGSFVQPEPATTQMPTLGRGLTGPPPGHSGLSTEAPTEMGGGGSGRSSSRTYRVVHTV